MAISTVELRHLLRLSNFELFDFDYQFDDQKMKAEIEEAITNHFLFSEIGQETPDRFKHVFEHRFKSVIGYYNELHNTTLLKYDPLINYRMSEVLERLADISTNTEQDFSENSSSFSSGKNSTTNDSIEEEKGDNSNLDYPQNTIVGDYRSDQQINKVDRVKNDIGSGTQSSEASGNTKGITKGKTNANQTENYQKKIEGITGKTYQELVRLERENIIRIKSMLIEEMKPCFMLVY